MYRAFKYLVFLLVIAGMTGCAASRPAPSRPVTKPVVKEKVPPQKPSHSVEKPVEKPPVEDRALTPKKPKPAEAPKEEKNPQALASIALSEQGKSLVERKRYDEAIRVLERAVNLHPRNGENYYYLAEAWLMKGNASQATEFNHLAGLYLKNDPAWQRRLVSQRARIRERLSPKSTQP